MTLNASRPKQLLKRVAQAGRLAVHLSRDGVRFWRHAALSVFDPGYEQLTARIMYNVHALEKGLAQSPGWRPGRGKKALRNLNDAMTVYRSLGYAETDFAFVQGLSILQRYQDRHVAHPQELAEVEAIVDGSFLHPKDSEQLRGSGLKPIRKAEKADVARRGFYELAQGRSSVRIFSGEPIDTRRVRHALENAEKTPSVCNRQGWRVYWTEDKDLAMRVLKHQRGFSSVQPPEVLLAITVSNSTFISPVERNQGFIDGGLYSMSVLYGLEAEGLAAVPLNACLYAKDRGAISKLLSIHPSEEIVMFIAVGDFPDEVDVPVSDRRPTESYLRVR